MAGCRQVAGKEYTTRRSVDGAERRRVCGVVHFVAAIECAVMMVENGRGLLVIVAAGQQRRRRVEAGLLDDGVGAAGLLETCSGGRR